MMTLEKKRSEYNTIAHHLRKHKCACANCGATEGVEFHHIVPLSSGGTNALTNLVPLCPKCHALAHNHEYHKKDGVKYGRPKKPAPKNYETFLDMYFAELIGRRELIDILGLENYRITDYWWYKDYCQKHGITGKWNNHVDHRRAKEAKGKYADT